MGGLGLLLVCLTVYLPGLWVIPPVDRDESRFAQASRQMSETGDFIVPRVQDRPRLNKPPLIYWLQCASVAVFGDEPGQYVHGNIWVFRVPSVLAAIGSVLITWRIGLRLFDARAAWLGAAMLAISPMVVWDAHQARADQLLLVCTCAAQWALLVVWKPGESRSSLAAASAFWIAVGAGVLAKGPITPLVSGSTILTLSLINRDRRWIRRLKPLVGLAILAAVVLPWVGAVGQRVGWGEYLRIVADETVGRSTSPKENHWFPPGFHMVLLPVLLWPGSLLTGLAFGRSVSRAFPATAARKPIWKRLAGTAGDPTSRFLLAWIVPVWIFFELISTKLPHYTMPLYPALALMSARAVFAAEAGKVGGVEKRSSRLGFALWVVIGAAATIGLSLAVLLGGRLSPDQPWRPLLSGLGMPAALIIVCLVAAARLLAKRRFFRAQVMGMLVVVIWGATFLQVILPNASNFWITPRIVAAVPPESRIGATGFVEDSLIFTTRGHAVRLSGGQMDSASFDGLDFVLSPEEQALSPAAESRLGEPVARVKGLNYANGKRVDVQIRPTGPVE